MRQLFSLGLVAFAWIAQCGDSRPAPVIREEDLQRISRELPKQFPWPTTRAVQPANPLKPASVDVGALPDMTGGDVIIKSMGEFLREEKDMQEPGGKPLKKEVLTLNKSVEIEQIPTQSVLRSDLIRVVNDKASGRTELLQATGNVEVVTPERSGRGETLLYEIKIGANDVTIKDLYTLEGNRAKNMKAVIWQGDDWIEAEKFVNDRRLETFRVVGGPRAVFRMPGSPEKAPQSAAAKAATAAGGAGGAGMLPGLEFSGGGKIKMQADGEMFYEGSMGKLRISRNVFIQQEGAAGPDGQPQPGLRMNADEVILNMEVPPPGQPLPPGSNLLSGGLRSLECTGRVEIRSPPRTVLCDRCVVDMARKTLHLEMKNPKDEVKVYIQENASVGKILVAPKSITVNMETGEFRAQGAQRMENFTGPVPSPRAEQAKTEK